MPTPSMNAARLDDHDRALLHLEDRLAALAGPAPSPALAALEARVIDLEGKIAFLIPHVQDVALRVGRSEDAAAAREARLAALEAALARLQPPPPKKKGTARLAEPADLAPAGLAAAATTPSHPDRGADAQDAPQAEDRVLPGPDGPDAQEG